MSDNKKQIIKQFQSMKPSVAFKQLDFSKFHKEVRDSLKASLAELSNDTLDLQFDQSTFKKWIEDMADMYPAVFGIKEDKKETPLPSAVKKSTEVVPVESENKLGDLETKVKDLETRLGVVKKMIAKQPAKRAELKIRMKTIEKMIVKFKEDLKKAKVVSKKKVIKKSLGGFLLGAVGGFIAGQLVDLKLTRKKVRFDLGGTIEGTKKYKYAIAYRTITPESSEAGDYDSQGWEWEYDIDELQDILQKAVNDYGIYHKTSSHDLSFESTSPNQDRDYFEKGIEVYYDLFIKNIDDSPISEEEANLISEKLKEGRKLNWDEEDKDWYKEGGVIHSKDSDGTLVFKADTKSGKYSIEVREGASGNLMNYDIREYTNGSSRGMSFISNKELLVHNLLDRIIGSKKIDSINYIISHDDLGVKEYLPASEKIWDIYNSPEFREWFKKQNETLTEEQKQSSSDELKNKAIKYVRDNGYKENDSTIGTFFQLFRKEKLIKDFYESKGMVMLKDGGNVSSEYFALTSNYSKNRIKIESLSFWNDKKNEHLPTLESIKDFLSQVPKDEIICIYDYSGNNYSSGLLHSAHTPLYSNGAKSVDAIVDENDNLIWNKYEGSKYVINPSDYKYAKGGGVDLDKDKFSLTSINDDLVQMVIGEDWTAKEFKSHFLNKGYEMKSDNSIVGFYFAKPDGQTFQLVPYFHKKGEVLKYSDGGSIDDVYFPKVQYKGDDRAFWYVVREEGDNAVLVFEEKLELWKNATKEDKREYYEEVENKIELEPYTKFKNGGNIGFIPMGLENDLAIISKRGGLDSIKDVIGILNAMIDSGLTDEDLVVTSTKTGTQYEKQRDLKTTELWNKIQDNYKGDLKGNQYYSAINLMVYNKNSMNKNLLKEFKPFRSNQKFENGGDVYGIQNLKVGDFVLNSFLGYGKVTSVNNDSYSIDFWDENRRKHISKEIKKGNHETTTQFNPKRIVWQDKEVDNGIENAISNLHAKVGGEKSKGKNKIKSPSVSRSQKDYNKDVDAYKFYVVNMETKKVESGFEYRQDAKDLLSDFEDPSLYKIIPKSKLSKMGIENPNEKWKSFKDGGVVKQNYDVVVKLKEELITKKDFDGFSKEDIIKWCEDRGWKHNPKGEKMGGRVLSNYEFFLKPIKAYNKILPKSKYDNGGGIGKAIENLHSKASSSTTPRGKNKLKIPDAKYVAVHESKDGYWTIASKPTTKENAEAMLGGTPKGELGKVVTLEEALNHKKVIGEEYLKMKDGGSMSSDNTPKVYIADLAAYNEGSLVGEWLDLSEFGSGEEVMGKISELLKQWSEEAGEEREEYSVHDMENFPKQMYSEGMGESSFQKVIDYWEAINGTDYPMEVVEDYASETGKDIVEAASEIKDNHYGTFSSLKDFAYEWVDSVGGISGVSRPEQYIEVSETDKRIISQEQADSEVDDLDDNDILERADLKDTYDSFNERADELGEDEELDDDDRVRTLESEFGYADSDEILEEAKEKVKEEISNEWEKGLDDAYNFLVEEKGLYSSDNLIKQSFIRFDYEAFGKDLEQDFTTIEHDGEVYVFNNN